jgi:CheY-like chemotaxis protein
MSGTRVNVALNATRNRRASHGLPDFLEEPGKKRLKRAWRDSCIESLAEDTVMHTGEHSLAAPAVKALRKVVVVNGNPEVLELLESALDGGRYDLVFADAGQHAYSIIKREQPDLVVLAVKIDVMEGFQLLSMLKLDRDTRRIPVVTYTTDSTDDDAEDEDDEDTTFEFEPRIPLRLH